MENIVEMLTDLMSTNRRVILKIGETAYRKL